jgi:glycosyltransferase involved in cell wall biosynthesis
MDHGIDRVKQFNAPLVSVVITTVNRPEELERAIASVLAQTMQDFEIVVVIVGPTDVIDLSHLAGLDERLRVLPLIQNVGLAEARNRGIHAGLGQWIALLDDDDEWLPGKLMAQVKAATEAKSEFVFVPCRFIERTLELSRIMPERLPRSADKFSEYIYCEHGYLQPSMYFFSHALGLAVPFTKGLRHVEDSDWMLRMSQLPGVMIRPVEECLSVYHNYKSGTRESETTPWRFALEWGMANHGLFTHKAFPYFVARLCVNARRVGESPAVLLLLLKSARKHGDLSLRVLVYFLSYWTVPPGVLRSVRRKLGWSRYKSSRVSTMLQEVGVDRLGGQLC